MWTQRASETSRTVRLDLVGVMTPLAPAVFRTFRSFPTCDRFAGMGGTKRGASFDIEQDDLDGDDDDDDDDDGAAPAPKQMKTANGKAKGKKGKGKKGKGKK